MTVIHPQSGTKAPPSQQLGTEGPSSETAAAAEVAAALQASEKAARPAHAQLSAHHVELRPQAVLDHYMEATMSDRTQAVVATGSKFISYYFFITQLLAPLSFRNHHVCQNIYFLNIQKLFINEIQLGKLVKFMPYNSF